MLRCVSLALAGALACPAGAQTFKFRFEPGAVLTYDSDFQHAAETRVGADKQTSRSRVRQSRQWKVVGQDGLGVTTLELTVVKMRVERTGPDGKTTVFDSTLPAANETPANQALAKTVGAPIQRLQLAANGVVKATEPLGGTKNVFADLPFQVTMPDEYVRKGLAWQREFAITLAPPLGRGEAHQARQRCELTAVAGDRLTVSTATELAQPPAAATAKIALAQFTPTGTVTLDLKRGLMLASEMSAAATIPGIAGEDSEYRYRSKATETLVEPAVAGAERPAAK